MAITSIKITKKKGSKGGIPHQDIQIEFTTTTEKGSAVSRTEALGLLAEAMHMICEEPPVEK